MKFQNLLAGAVFASTLALSASTALANTCVGNCGTSGADGVVTLSPTGNGSYGWVSTDSGVGGAGEISGVGGTNGSSSTSSPFASTAGQGLTFYFNYVTSDGAGFVDYSWAELQTSGGAHVAWLFTARTQASGNTSPGFGLPANDSTLTPASSAIVPGGPAWSPLGNSSNACYGSGCGYTGWIKSTYNIAAAGNYQVVYGVTNWNDKAYQSGLAFDGLAIGGVPVGVPEPATWALMMIGVGGVGAALRGRRRAIQA